MARENSAWNAGWIGLGRVVRIMTTANTKRVAAKPTVVGVRVADKVAAVVTHRPYDAASQSDPFVAKVIRAWPLGAC